MHNLKVPCIPIVDILISCCFIGLGTSTSLCAEIPLRSYKTSSTRRLVASKSLNRHSSARDRNAMSFRPQNLFADALRRLEVIARSAPSAVKHHPTASLTALAAASVTLAWLRSNYLEFKALGPGGLPYNFRGWLIALLLKAVSRETLSCGEYDQDPDQNTWFDDHDSIPVRAGVRPRYGFHVVPARQLDQIPSKESMQVSRVRYPFSHILMSAATARGLHQAR